jgi:hypothetical protein
MNLIKIRINKIKFIIGTSFWINWATLCGS